MSLDLTGIFRSSTQFQTSKGIQTDGSGRAEGVNGQTGAGKTEPLSLSIGSTISGTVQEGKENLVSIQLRNGQTVLARLEESLSFGKGEKVMFSVSGMSDGQYILKSLFQNTAMQATGEKALLQAGIAVNENSLSMVSEMMEDGMPVDKNSLQAMYKEVVAHPQTSGANIVAMNRLQIPVTDANVNQFQAYLNLEHQISQGVSQLSDSLMDVYQSLAADKDPNASEVMKQLVMIFAQEPDAGGLEQMKAADHTAYNGTDTVDKQLAEGNELKTAQPESANILPNTNPEAMQNQEAPYLEALKRIAAFSEGGAEVEQAVEEKSVSEKTAGNLAETLKALGMNEETITSLMKGEGMDKELLGFAKQLLTDPAVTGDMQRMEKLHKLFDSKEFQTAVKNEMSRQLLLSPQELSQKEDVGDYYTRLNQQLGRMAQSLAHILPQDSQPMQQLFNMQDNLQFMEQMNQTMSYIQLPMKLLSDQAHGDLYVYTNKRNLADSDGTVSAFLHLDMDHLGPVDVYVAMQDKKVTTNFTLQDDEMIDFIAARIDQLNERLEKKGYQVTANISKKEKETSVMQEMIEDHKQMHLIGTKSFDVRA